MTLLQQTESFSEHLSLGVDKNFPIAETLRNCLLRLYSFFETNILRFN